MAGGIETTVRVEGLADLSRALREVSDAAERRVLVKSVRAASAYVLDLAKKKAPRGTGAKRNRAGKSIGHMADSLIVVSKKTRAGQIKDVIGSATHGPLLHLVEFGTAPHAQKRGQHPGPRAQPFLRPAIDEGGEKAMDAFAAEMDAGLKREVARAGRAAARSLKKGFSLW